MRTRRGVLALLAGLGLYACGGTEEPKKTYAIGAIVGLTGNNSDVSYGQSCQLAVDQLNQALAKEGEDFRFKLILEDSEADPTTAMQRGLDAIQNQGARSVVWDTSQDVIVAAQSYYDSDPTNDLNVVLMDGFGSGAAIINPNGAPWQVDPDNWIWRTVMSSTVPAYQAIDVLNTYTPTGNLPGDINGDGVVKVSMFGTNDGLGQPLVADASTRALALFGPNTVIEKAFHDPGASVDVQSTWTDFVTKLLDSNDDLSTGTVPGHVPDMLFAGLQVLYNVPTYKAYKASGSNVPFMGSLAMAGNVFLSELGALAEGAQSVGFGSDPSRQSTITFANDFQTAYGASGVAGFYDATVLLGLAAIIGAHQTGDIDTVGNDDIKAALPQTSTVGADMTYTGVDGLRAAIRAAKAGQAFNYDGASGPLDFDQYGDVRSYVGRNQVESGQWVASEVYDCTQSRTECVPLN